MSNPRLENLVQEIAPFGVQARRFLHEHPELSFQERETSAFVRVKLTELGYTPESCGGGYGIKAVLRGGKPGKTIALRADMDALPMDEETGLPFASKISGVMHACGHDMHTATLLSAAKALKAIQSELAGNVVFIFQPAEETPPGGAIGMVRDGVLENPRVDAVFGLHVDPFLPVGQLAFAPGPRNAAADLFDLKIFGRGGHGAAPHQTVDSVLVAAQVVNALQHIHSRQINPFDQLVITVGHLQAGSKHNIIADQALLRGTVRIMNPDLHARVPEMMEKIITGVCATYGATCHLDYQRGYPVLIADTAMTEIARAAAVDTVGTAAVQTPEPGMYGEDFAYYALERPAAFGSLGVADPSGRGALYPCHHPKLMVHDELAMPVGIRFYLNLVTRFLGQ